MSDLQHVAQDIAVIVANTKASITLLNARSEQLNQMLLAAKSSMQGTSRGNYQEVLNQLAFAQKKLENAVNNLLNVTTLGDRWLINHAIVFDSGTPLSHSMSLNESTPSSIENTDYSIGNTASTFFERPDCGNSFNEYSTLIDFLEKRNIAYLPLETITTGNSENDIVKRLAGGDQTAGSCSSLAFAYCGNKAGYAVLDFRDGESRRFFSNNNSILQITNLPNVKSLIEWGNDDELCANRLMAQMESGKEYYLATGEHAAIVRLNNGHYEYLELQSPGDDNGWHPLHPISLYERFGCGVNTTEYPNVLIEVESLSKNTEFLDLLGYINTSECNQNKGTSGYAK